MTDLDPAVVAKLAQATGLGLRMLSARVLAILALLMTFALYVWAMQTQTWLGYLIASTFGLLAFLPSLWLSRSQESPHG